MTTLPTLVGPLPMALAYGVGSEANQYVMFEERFPRRIATPKTSRPHCSRTGRRSE